MKGITGWNYAPYEPPLFHAGRPYINRVVPRENGIRIEWLNLGEEKEYEVFAEKRGEELQKVESTKESFCEITSLEKDTDYAVQVKCGESQSRIRLARTQVSVGTIVNYLHPDDEAYAFSGRYLCSPSMVRTPTGALLASMDLFAPDAPQNLTLIFRSEDDGETWHYVSELMPCFWGKMFFHHGKLYMLACSQEYGDLLIGVSEDEGKTFSAPVALLRGSCSSKMEGVHKNPQPVVEYKGRIWNTLEWGAWARGYHAPMVMSAAADADLLNPESWTITEPVVYNPNWPGVAKGPSAGNIEGTLVVFPDGKLYNVMRYDMGRCQPNYGMALAYRVNDENPESKLTFAKAIPFPGNHSKFEIHRDEKTGKYYSIVSRILGPDCAQNRNLLSLVSSEDLNEWKLETDLIDRRNDDPKLVGFQYVDFFFEGDDLLYLCRTALNGAHNFHDANQQTFHRVRNFRNL